MTREIRTMAAREPGRLAILERAESAGRRQAQAAHLAIPAQSLPLA